MRKHLKVLALCAAALLAAHMMAQDTGGGGQTGGAGQTGADTSGGTGDASGTTSPDNSGGMTNPDNSGAGTGTSTSGGENTNGGTSSPNTGTGTGTGTEGGTGTTTTPGTGELPANGTGTQGSGTIVPPTTPTTLPPGFAAPVPGTTPVPVPALPGPNTVNPGAQGGTQAPPVTFTLPGAYGGGSSQTFTLGSGRLAKPPITFTTTVSQGYDDNLFDADSHVTAVPTPKPAPTPPLETVLTGATFNPTTVTFTPIFNTFRPKAAPTPKVSPTPATLGVIGSPVTTLSLGVQVQNGSPRTVVTGDASFGANQYWDRPGEKTDYTGNMDLQFVHTITPRATISLSMFAVYQNTPNFALINAPTNSGQTGGNYLNGSIKIDLSYGWTARLSTVTSYSLNLNLLDTNATQNLYENTIGTQFRYTVSPRNTITAEVRETEGVYPSNASANNTSGFYLLGLDTFFSSKLRNTFSVGIQEYAVSNAGGSSMLPYFESDTTLYMARGAYMAWTNNYGYQPSSVPTETVTEYRTGLTYGQPLSTKLTASVSIAYNIVTTTDSAIAANSNKQNQFQASASLGYMVSPRLSLNLSYTYLDLLSSLINSSYTRDQIYLGGTYTFQ